MAKKNTNKGSKIIYGILILLIIACVVVIIILLDKKEKTLTPDFAPGTIDTDAIKEDDSGKKMDVSSGGGAVSLSYSNVVMIDSSSKQVKMYFKNPGKSRESIVLEIVIEQNGEEYVLAKSDLLPPGYALYKMNLDTDIELPVGGYKGIFRISYYDEESGAKQIVNTKIDVSIEIK